GRVSGAYVEDFFFSSRRAHTRSDRDWSSDVCSSDLAERDGGTWSAPAPLSPAGQPAWAPALAAGPDGTVWCAWDGWDGAAYQIRSEEHTSELQSRSDLVCRLLLEKKKNKKN